MTSVTLYIYAYSHRTLLVVQIILKKEIIVLVFLALISNKKLNTSRTLLPIALFYVYMRTYIYHLCSHIYICTNFLWSGLMASQHQKMAFNLYKTQRIGTQMYLVDILNLVCLHCSGTQKIVLCIAFYINV